MCFVSGFFNYCVGFSPPLFPLPSLFPDFFPVFSLEIRGRHLMYPLFLWLFVMLGLSDPTSGNVFSIIELKRLFHSFTLGAFLARAAICQNKVLGSKWENCCRQRSCPVSLPGPKIGTEQHIWFIIFKWFSLTQFYFVK